MFKEIAFKLKLYRLYKKYRAKQRLGVSTDTIESIKKGNYTKLLMSVIFEIYNYSHSPQYHYDDYQCEISKHLIEHGADMNIKCFSFNDFIQEIEGKGFTLLMACIDKYNDKLAELLISSGADLEIMSDDGYNALLMAALIGSVDIVEKLLEYGANVNVVCENINYYGYTPLKMALEKRLVLESIIKDKAAIAIKLIEHGANVDATIYEKIKQIYPDQKYLLRLAKQAMEKKEPIFTKDKEINTLINNIIKTIGPLENIKIKIIEKINALLTKYKEDLKNLEPTFELDKKNPELTIDHSVQALKIKMINSLELILASLNKSENLLMILNEIQEYKDLTEKEIETPSTIKDINDKILYIISKGQEHDNASENEEISILNELDNILSSAEVEISNQLLSELDVEIHLTLKNEKDVKYIFEEKIEKLYENVKKYNEVQKMMSDSSIIVNMRLLINNLQDEDKMRLNNYLMDFENSLSYNFCKSKTQEELMDLIKKEFTKLNEEIAKVMPASLKYHDLFEDISESLGVIPDSEKTGVVESKVKEMMLKLDNAYIPESVYEEVRNAINEVLDRWRNKLKTNVKLDSNQRYDEVNINEEAKLTLEIIKELTAIDTQIERYIIERQKYDEVAKGLSH